MNDSDAQLLIAHEQCIPTFDAMDAVPELIAIGGVVTTGGAVTGDRHDFDRLVAVGSSSFNPRSLRKVLIAIHTPLGQRDFQRAVCKRISIGAKYRH